MTNDTRKGADPIEAHNLNLAGATPASATLETYSLVLDLRNALAASIRVLASDDFHGTRIDAFLEEVRRLGIKDGIGVRANEWLKKEKDDPTPKD